MMKLVFGLLLAMSALAGGTAAAQTLTTNADGGFTLAYDIDLSTRFPGSSPSYVSYFALPVPEWPGYINAEFYRTGTGEGFTFDKVQITSPWQPNTGSIRYDATITGGASASAIIAPIYSNTASLPSRPFGPYLFGLEVTGPATSGFKGFVSFMSAPGVPEPATWAMLLTGFALTGATIRRARTRRLAVSG